MTVENYMDEARMIAAQCWCDDETKDRVMDPVLAEAFAKRIATWMHTAATFADGASFYRNLLNSCALNLGPLQHKAFIADDGSLAEDPLRLKIPALVAELAAMAQGGA